MEQTFSNALMKWMDDHVMTVRTMAEKFDVEPGAVKKWLAGKNMCLKNKTKILKMTGIDYYNPETWVVDGAGCGSESACEKECGSELEDPFVEGLEIPFIQRELIATIKQFGCAGCVFIDTSDSTDDTCAFVAERITGLMCSKDSVIFKFKERWISCPNPTAIKAGDTVRHKESKKIFTVIAPPINRGEVYKNRMVVQYKDGEEIMDNYTEFELKVGA